MSTRNEGKGERRRHSVLGEGRVTDSRRGGREVRFVVSETGLPYWVRAETLESLVERASERPRDGFEAAPSAAPGSGRATRPEGMDAARAAGATLAARAAPTVGRAPSAVPTPGAGRATPRAALEALRLGVVPAEGIERFTVGLALERAIIEGDLARASAGGSVRFFTASYGSGKSHTLELASQMALARGFAVASAELDPEEVTFRRPKRLYRALARSLRLPGSTESGIESLVQRIRPPRGEESLGTWAERTLGGLRVLGPAIQNYWRASPGSWAREVVLGYMAGEEVPASILNLRRELDKRLGRFRSIRNASTPGGAEATVDLMADLARLVKLAGAKGLAILVDEGEHYRELSPVMRYRADHLMEALLGMIRSGRAPSPDPTLLSGVKVPN